MCGIAGLLGVVDKQRLRAMADCQSHRGPDADGYYDDLTRSGVGIGLAHRRLAIVDLSKKGKQPMTNAKGDVVVVFNGEIYNFKTLRAELEAKGYRFKSNSDTEVLVHGYSEWGVNLPEKLDGDFAFAVWDAKKKELFLARGPAGVCPLSYAWVPNSGAGASGKGGKGKKTFAFASEQKALFAAGIKPAINTSALESYFALSYVPAPQTLFAGVFSFPNAHWARVKNGTMVLHRFSSFSFEKSKDSVKGLLKEGRRLFRLAVQKRLQSDVPLGSYLSGGLDSSYLAAVLAELVPEGPHTFTIQFEGGEDESPYAKQVADKFLTKHHEMPAVLDPNLLPAVTWHLDTPAADIAALPTYQMAQLAKRYVTVVLTGDGGDEVFGGYPRYAQLPLVYWQNFVARKFFAPASTAVRFWRGGAAGQRAAEILWKADSKSDLFLTSVSAFSPLEQRESICAPGVIGKDAASLTRLVRPWFAVTGRDLQDDLMDFDLHNLLPEDYLMKVNKSSMAFAVEPRVPFLDKALVQFGASLPVDLKIRGLNLKHFMRQMVSDRLPPEIVNRPKQGFNVPTQKWLEGTLREPAERLLSDATAHKRGWVKSGVGKKVLASARQNLAYSSKRFWNLFALELWARVYLDDAPEDGIIKPKATLDAYL